MADLARLTLPSGNTYNLKDSEAREMIRELLNIHEYLGVTTTLITDGSTTNPVEISGVSVTAVASDLVTYEHDEFVFSSVGTWQKFGDLTSLGALAYKNTASGNYTPAGTVSQPSFTGSELTSEGSYTPQGSVSGAAVTLSKKNIGSVTNAGSMPTYTVSNETLVITAGAVPTVETESVAEDVDEVTQPTFSGTAATLQVKGTPAGTVSQPTFSGTQDTITVS